MVQAKKALPAAVRAVRPGGTVILVAECPRGWGAVQADGACLLPGGERRLAYLASQRRRGRVEVHWAAVSPAVMFHHARRKARLIVVSAMGRALAGTLAEPAASLSEALDLALGSRRQAVVGVITDGRWAC
jgi:nickel-dependent lactate racemase